MIYCDVENWNLKEKFMEKFPELNPDDGVLLQMADQMKGKRIIKTHLPFSFFQPSLLNTCKVRLKLINYIYIW